MTPFNEGDELVVVDHGVSYTLKGFSGGVDKKISLIVLFLTDTIRVDSECLP